MAIPSLVWTYTVVLATVMAIDVSYLYLVAAPLFQDQVLAVQRTSLEVDKAAALACYLVIAALVTYLCFLSRIRLPASEQELFLVGLGIYLVFELTCKAIFVQWNWTTVIVDSVWGGVLFALAGWTSKRVLQKTSN